MINKQALIKNIEINKNFINSNNKAMETMKQENNFFNQRINNFKKQLKEIK